MNEKYEKINFFVSGRLCLFGEYSDWAGMHRIINADIVSGTMIVTGIKQGIYAEVEKSDQFIIHNESEELKDFIGNRLTGVVLNDTMYDIENLSSYHVSFDGIKRI